MKISVEQKITLSSAQLILTRHMTNFKAKTTEGVEVTIQNSLKVGDQVVLLRQQGGQKFLVLDRVVSGS